MYGAFQLHNLTLELSGKAFLNDSEEEQRRVARLLFGQWKRLTDHADAVSVLLWIADGSEILEYTGNMADTFEWARYQGIANPLPAPESPTPEQRKNFNYFPLLYRPDAAPRSYGWLAALIRNLKEVGKTECGGKPVRVGATFDNGPEFAVSDFKYRRHREIARGNSIYPHSFVTCDAELHADPEPYAGFPGGIPEGTGIGTFLGRQYAAMARDLGYDYLWLSNGMGFGTETWGVTGALFDQHRFYPEKKAEATRKILKFWQELRAAVPGALFETRGSNYTAGIEMATDAAPLEWLYDNRVIAPPVNSPMASIEFNPGVTLAGWMSHIAELPAAGYRMRYYIHDPWFLNSPWLDRYGRQPWDLYPELCVSRLNAAGETEGPDKLSLLTCDDSYGEMPQQVPDEVIPHLIEGFSNVPDQCGPLLWVYPFREYAKMTDPARTFNEDAFIGAAIQNGLPLNTVVSPGNFREVLASRPDRLAGVIPVVPVSALADPATAEAVFQLAERSAVLVYGGVAGCSRNLAAKLGLGIADGLTGSARVYCRLRGDGADFPDRIFLHEQFSGGPAVETALPGTQVLAEAEFPGGRRVLAARRGMLFFVRALPPVRERYLPENPTVFQTRHLNYASPGELFPTARLPRWILAESGWIFRAGADTPDQPPPLLCIARRENAFFFCGHTPDTTVPLEVATPLGVPVAMEQETRLRNGMGVWHTPKAFRFEVRVFIKQEADGVISGKLLPPLAPGFAPRLEVRNLLNAEVRCLVPPGATELEVRRQPGNRFLPVEWEETPGCRCLIVRNAEGAINFGWSLSTNRQE